MLDVVSYRLQLDKLRQQLAQAWAEVPFPLDKITQLNGLLINALAESGLGRGKRRMIRLDPAAIEAERLRKKISNRQTYLKRREREANRWR